MVNYVGDCLHIAVRGFIMLIMCERVFISQISWFDFQRLTD